MFQEEIEKENRIKKLKGSIIPLLLILNTLTLLINWSKPLFLTETSFTNLKPPLKRICELGFLSLLKQKADPNLFSDSIYEYLEDGNYKLFDFKQNTKINHITLDNQTCTLITNDHLGLRSFKIDLKNSSRPFLFAITNIEENQPKGN